MHSRPSPLAPSGVSPSFRARMYTSPRGGSASAECIDAPFVPLRMFTSCRGPHLNPHAYWNIGGSTRAVALCCTFALSTVSATFTRVIACRCVRAPACLASGSRRRSPRVSFARSSVMVLPLLNLHDSRPLCVLGFRVRYNGTSSPSFRSPFSARAFPTSSEGWFSLLVPRPSPGLTPLWRCPLLAPGVECS